MGCGLVINPAFSILGVYFRKRVSIASGLVMCGSGVGSLLFSYLTQYLVDEYGISGALLICGGLTFNIVFGATLMRPLQNPLPTPREGAAVDTVVRAGRRPVVVVARASSPESRRRLDSVREGEVGLQSVYGSLEVYVRSMSTLAEPADDNDHNVVTFPWYLFKDDAFLLFTLSAVLFLVTYINIYQLLPLITDKVGDGRFSGATMIGFMSIAETISRVLWGLFWDHDAFRAPTVRMIGTGSLLAVSGGLAFACIFITVNEVLAGWTMVMGVLVAGVFSTLVPITMDICGPAQVGNGYAILMLFEGLLMMVDPLLIGCLIDRTGTVDSAIYVLGASFLASGIFISVTPLVRQWRGLVTDVSPQTVATFENDDVGSQSKTTHVLKMRAKNPLGKNLGVDV
ncbi:PREDICTED: monocarboxylate transporter 12-B-like [Priapulus caudatus]|uniref:Monocarboxylate transporter 12-B-like n=1 Tax=Priapulus caudatus TaxID=37621 RepID=A0ABM1ET80_PRICU|nr:PREDICTED: monocarboxylate transporter 12-B-like [Priapulus caudatus]